MENSPFSVQDSKEKGLDKEGSELWERNFAFLSCGYVIVKRFLEQGHGVWGSCVVCKQLRFSFLIQ